MVEDVERVLWGLERLVQHLDDVRLPHHLEVPLKLAVIVAISRIEGLLAHDIFLKALFAFVEASKVLFLRTGLHKEVFLRLDFGLRVGVVKGPLAEKAVKGVDGILHD
jgi:hypothetical protein